MSDPGAPAAIDQALAQLRDPEPEIRVRAVRRLRVIETPVRNARSLPEGRSLALRELERREGPGERSRPHPAESLAGGAART